MIYIDNLTELLALVIEQGLHGVLCPQNEEYVSTARMMEEIARNTGRIHHRLPILNLLVRLFLPLSLQLRSAFGNLYYARELAVLPINLDYQVVEFEESIKRSVSGYE